MSSQIHQPTNRPVIVLLHGLHMHAWAMIPLAKQLTKMGFDCRSFGYYSVMHDLPRHSQRLNQWLSTNFTQGTSIYLVGHSLGGLVVRDFVYRYPEWQIPRCVTLGTPHNGSLSADNVVKIFPSLVGRAYLNGLDGTAPALPSNVELGSIAGSQSVGLGKLILPRKNRFSETGATEQATMNDGTVFVHETKLANAKDHVILPTSHTGLLFYPDVAVQISHFLQHGQFQ